MTLQPAAPFVILSSKALSAYLTVKSGSCTSNGRVRWAHHKPRMPRCTRVRFVFALMLPPSPLPWCWERVARPCKWQTLTNDTNWRKTPCFLSKWSTQVICLAKHETLMQWSSLLRFLTWLWSLQDYRRQRQSFGQGHHWEILFSPATCCWCHCSPCVECRTKQRSPHFLKLESTIEYL